MHTRVHNLLQQWRTVKRVHAAAFLFRLTDVVCHFLSLAYPINVTYLTVRPPRETT